MNSIPTEFSEITTLNSNSNSTSSIRLTPDHLLFVSKGCADQFNLIKAYDTEVFFLNYLY